MSLTQALLSHDTIESPSQRRIHEAILTLLHENRYQLLSACLGFLLILTTVLFLTVYFFEILHGIKELSKGIWWVGCRAAYYYSIVVLRYLTVITSGIGYDITASYCQLPYEWTRIHRDYQTATNQSGFLYNTTGYYEFCITNTENALYTFFWAHLSLLLCFCVNAACTYLADTTLYPKYVEFVATINAKEIAYFKSHEYEIDAEKQALLKAMKRAEFFVFSNRYHLILYVCTSGINYALRRTTTHLSAIHLPLLATVLFVGEVLLIGLALKCTRVHILEES